MQPNANQNEMQITSHGHMEHMTGPSGRNFLETVSNLG